MKKNNMRLYVLLIFFLIAGTKNVFSQITSPDSYKACYYYDGYWSDWKSQYDWEIKGSYNGFIIYDKFTHPSNYFFKFYVAGRIAPDKKEIKQHYKSKTWWEYGGSVEYYVCDVYPTFKDCIKELGRPLKKEDLETTEYQNKLSILRASYLSKGNSFSPTGLTKKSSPAKIKIAPYPKKSKVPQVYNIWFDGVGLGFDMGWRFFENRR